ncbi:hypothetical protein B0H10DRAFT_1912336 [Mycena sp. CBHHK59/15]|nr:hypothetical protein B0H10DRAFT_1912336 [Mycena sp. CBHHK59/15]
MQLGQFSASVSVDGVALAEFATEYSADGKEATCWIPSESDKQFTIEWRDERASASIMTSGFVLVDGVCCGGKVMKLQKSQPDYRRISMARRDSVAVSATTRRPLIFSKQALTDDDAYLNATISPDFGSIKLHIRQVKDKTSSRIVWREKKTQVLHERSKKVIGHSVQFGAEFQTRPNSQIKSILVAQLVTFVFKYRPIGLLRAEGIAPPEVGQKRRASDSVDLDLTLVDNEDEEDEIKRLEARLNLLKNKGAKRVKREPSSVKKEPKTEPIFQVGEVIDLT